MSRFVIALSDRRARQRSNAGSKGSRLAHLLERGFHIPPAFIISPLAYEQLLRAIEPAIKPPDQYTREERLRIREQILEATLPPEIESAIVDAFQRLGTAVAVRSSMLAEDGSEASFAGQLESFLDIDTADAVLDAVRRCYASVLGDRVSSYIQEKGESTSRHSPDEYRTAVIVQAMVPARYAGVAFSADPNTGRRCVIIEAVPSTGSSVARGIADPDRYVIGPRGMMIEERIVSDTNDKPRREAILELAHIARMISIDAGEPQDIEWAWDGDAFHILQARAITNLTGKDIYSSKLVSDMTPGLIKPLLWSTNIIDMTDNVFGRIFTELLGRRDIDYTRIVELIHSRVYVNVTFVGNLLKQFGLPPNFFEMMVLDELAEKRRPRLTPRLALSLLKLTRFAARYGFYGREVTAFIKKHEERLALMRTRSWDRADEQALFDAARDMRAWHGETQWYMWISAMNMTVRNKLLKRFVKRHVPTAKPSELLAGCRGLKSLEPNRELKMMSERIRDLDPELRDVLVDGDDAAIRARLEETETGTSIVRDFDSFMERYGYLSAQGTDFSVPPWRENPSLIWSGIGRLSVERSVEKPDEAQVVRDGARERIEARMSPFRRGIFRTLLSSTLRHIAMRERVSFYMSEDVYHMRRIYRALGSFFAERGIIDDREDIFCCFFSELPDMIGGGIDQAAVRSRIAERKEALAEDAYIELDSIICGDGAPMPLKETADAHAYLTGVTGSTGVARGFAHVVHDPSQVRKTLTKSDILVVPFTDVGWTPLFPSIGGIIADTGGQLSHSAIIAREYGIPAVVSVKHATRTIREGQAVTVDGTAGRVYLEHKE